MRALDAPLSDAFLRGARLFDRGAFFGAHEAWEDHWREEMDPSARLLLQGLIQVAAAFHKLIVMKSAASASRLLDRGLAKLDACPGALAPRDLAPFRAALRLCAQAIAEGRFDPPMIPPLERP